MRYRATVTVEIHDDVTMSDLSPTILQVYFDEPADPRTLLFRIALREARELARQVQRHFTG